MKRIGLLCSILFWSFAAGAQHCEPVPAVNADGWGPYDYRDQNRKKELANVEGHHLNSDVESLKRGQSGTIGADLTYTLYRFPNHHRALLAYMRLGEKVKSDIPSDSRFSVSCAFARAVQYAPNDGAVRMLNGVYLLKQKKVEEAISELKIADQLEPNNAQLHYNMGLAYVQIKNYPDARTHAKKAYDLGFPLPGLRQMLQRAGQWDAEPAAARPVKN